MTPAEQSAIGIIGGADGPTAVFVSGIPMSLVALGIIALAVIVILATRKR